MTSAILSLLSIFAMANMEKAPKRLFFSASFVISAAEVFDVARMIKKRTMEEKISFVHAFLYSVSFRFLRCRKNDDYRVSQQVRNMLDVTF